MATNLKKNVIFDTTTNAVLPRNRVVRKLPMRLDKNGSCVTSSAI